MDAPAVLTRQNVINTVNRWNIQIHVPLHAFISEILIFAETCDVDRIVRCTGNPCNDVSRESLSLAIKGVPEPHRQLGRLDEAPASLSPSLS